MISEYGLCNGTNNGKCFITVNNLNSFTIHRVFIQQTFHLTHKELQFKLLSILITSMCQIIRKIIHAYNMCR